MKILKYKNLTLTVIIIFVSTQMYAQNRQSANFAYDKTGQLKLEELVDQYNCFFVYDNVGNLLRKVSQSQIESINNPENDNVGNIFIFPNPAEEVINLVFNQFTGDKIIIEIIDINGAVVLKQETRIIDNQPYEIRINNLGSGYYNLRISNLKRTKNASFIKL